MVTTAVGVSHTHARQECLSCALCRMSHKTTGLTQLNFGEIVLLLDTGAYLRSISVFVSPQEKIIQHYETPLHKCCIFLPL